MAHSRPNSDCQSAIIANGVTIGGGTIIAACSVVQKDVSSWTIVADKLARVLCQIKVGA